MSVRMIFLLCAMAFGAFVGSTLHLELGEVEARREHLLADCMADGKREYRCDIELREAGL